MKRILIFHPEGNIANNPGLHGIVEILCQEGYAVDVVSPAREDIFQGAPCAGATLILTNAFSEVTLSQTYDLAIGVDLGIMDAAVFAAAKAIPLGYFSYEIFFRGEVSDAFKQYEIAACRNISFAVCQDPVRAKHLSEQNRIPVEKIILIPVAGRSKPEGAQRTFLLHEKLGINRAKKVALFAGSIAGWSMIEETLETVARWPDDWVLVLHDRYGDHAPLVTLLSRHGLVPNEKVFISSEPIPDFDAFGKFVSSADLGIAFYRATATNMYDGNNIAHIGLSSGKVATFIRNGVPVVVNQTGALSELIDQYEAGFVVDQPSELAGLLRDGKELWLERKRHNCYRLFDEQFNLDHKIKPLLTCIRNIEKAPSDAAFHVGGSGYARLLFECEVNKNTAADLSRRMATLTDKLNKVNRAHLAVKGGLEYRAGKTIMAPLRVMKKIYHWIF